MEFLSVMDFASIILIIKPLDLPAFGIQLFA